jgi:hypothetical protein
MMHTTIVESLLNDHKSYSPALHAVVNATETIFFAVVTAVSDVWTMVFFTSAIVAIMETMLYAKQKTFLIRRTRFLVNWRIVTDLATIVSVSPAIASDTCATFCVLSPTF